ncbi:Rz-like spanin [Salmonella phage vB_SalP_QS]
MKSSNMLPVLAVLSVSFLLNGCQSNNAPLRMLIPSPDMTLMQPPCKLIPPSSDADEDLAIDVRNAECTRQLRLKVFRLQEYIRNILE